MLNYEQHIIDLFPEIHYQTQGETQIQEQKKPRNRNEQIVLLTK